MRFYFDLTAGKYLFFYTIILSFRYTVIPNLTCYSPCIFLSFRAHFLLSFRVQLLTVIPSASERIPSVVIGLRIREYNSCGRYAAFHPW